MAPRRIHLVRHGQGQHNVEPLATTQLIHDPYLTELGVHRCQNFNSTFPDDVHVDLVCASPMRRTIQTARFCFHDLIPTTSTQKILLLPDAQETTAKPCDTGSPPAQISEEFGDLVDASLVSDDWTSKQGIYATDPVSLRARALRLRKWLMARPEAEIVLVSHGAILDYVTGENLDEHQVFKGPKSGWDNREWRFYSFKKDDLDGATLVEEKESVMRRQAV